MGHDKLTNHYQTNFGLMQHHKWSLTEMENMLPWERYIYIDLLQAFIKDEELAAKQRELDYKAQVSTFNRQMTSRQKR